MKSAVFTYAPFTSTYFIFIYSMCSSEKRAWSKRATSQLGWGKQICELRWYLRLFLERYSFSFNAQLSKCGWFCLMREIKNASVMFLLKSSYAAIFNHLNSLFNHLLFLCSRTVCLIKCIYSSSKPMWSIKYFAVKIFDHSPFHPLPHTHTNVYIYRVNNKWRRSIFSN